MNIVIGSKHVSADIAIALDVAGREHLVVAAKSTWSIPQPGQRPRPLPPQSLAQSDIYAGKPGESAMLYGADFARFKPRCDVLFNANAHAPAEQPVTELLVAWQVGSLRKGLRVIGPRTWRSRLGVVSLSKPELFVSHPLHYGMAFGGAPEYTKGSGEVMTETFLENPAGTGWAGPHTISKIHNRSAPGLEAMDDPIRGPRRSHTPVAFSAIARNWPPRKNYAGTYDDAWQRDIFPLLPEDYDERYNQCAPESQQMDYPRGGEQVVLRNMMKGRSDVRFLLPPLNQQTVKILRTDFSNETLTAIVDTLYFEPDENRFSVVWRVSTPIRRRIQEFSTLAIGPVSASWWESKVLGRDGAGCRGCGNGTDSEQETT
ncbi:DUF2169 family type VI secretion system accessory protein [Massilia pseudoviolaceinigra]|uniref:DUF2169 family type VI secretion system accessory protein n=1 Tax=Massilia pseudoviolaceinigra TaxID=3057165 RepID=UPI0027968395|nr:DUF2169 domain-containing protein [Massilia sp. CCM 9206]MDQ1918743.1 DUF2169 domain-containing protein [Massilia sp. CCM 9206]